MKHGRQSLFESLNFELAGRSNVLLLGRGAQVVLQNFRGISHARIIAPEHIRMERFAKAQKIAADLDDVHEIINNLRIYSVI